MPLFHDTLWKVTAIDIEFTLARVMRRVRGLDTRVAAGKLHAGQVLRDMSVDKPTRQHRAEVQSTRTRLLHLQVVWLHHVEGASPTGQDHAGQWV